MSFHEKTFHQKQKPHVGYFDDSATDIERRKPLSFEFEDVIYRLFSTSERIKRISDRNIYC